MQQEMGRWVSVDNVLASHTWDLALDHKNPSMVWSVLAVPALRQQRKEDVWDSLANQTSQSVKLQVQEEQRCMLQRGRENVQAVYGKGG